MNKKNPTLLIDLDCTMVEMLTPWLDQYNQITGENIRAENLTEYNLTKVCKDSKTLDTILNQPGFFYNMQPMPGAVAVVQSLIDEGYNIIIVTQPPRRAEFAVRDKRRWMLKYFPNFDLTNIIFCHKKELIRGDLLFDDNPSHVVKWHQSNPKKILATLDWKYNDLPEVNKIVHFRGSLDNGWSDFGKFVRRVLPI